MKILDGKNLARQIKTSLKKEIEKNILNQDHLPHLVIIQVGDNSASNLYIKRKIAVGEGLGIKVTLEKFEQNITEPELIQKIETLNQDYAVDGIIIQLPLPAHLNFQKLISKIDQKKDIDGLGQENIYALVSNQEKILPATTRGVLTLLKENQISVQGKKVVVIGRSLLVGKSLALALMNRNATVTICHSQTQNLAKISQQADILISAVGKPNFINKDFVNSNQVIIDIGITTVDGIMKGDVHSEIDLADLALAKSPVPGGVGPMTVISLFQNLLDSYNLK